MAKKAVFKPLTHDDVVTLFGSLQDELKMVYLGGIPRNDKGQTYETPDGEVLDYSFGEDQALIKTVEFELSTKTWNHGDNLKEPKIDYVICWERDESKNIDNLVEKVIELKFFLKGLLDKPETFNWLSEQKLERVKNYVFTKEWTESDFRGLSRDSQTACRLLFDSDKPLSNDEIQKHIKDTRGKGLGGVMGGFTQKQNSGYERIIQRPYQKHWEFNQNLKDKYREIVTKICKINS